MKNFLILTMFVFGLSVSVSAQERPPLPPHPSKSELINHKRNELDKKYNTERKLILNHPLLSKKMKRAQLQDLDNKYRKEKQLLKKMK
ncbi:hypothetical protein [Chryseobacterium flavum]|uniref:hypothetical protein n=1 Tax=Chryseobacterium flavum TaxID=415851 RepID=UPI0028B19417|nr:hypothetical protein [Chryseobacterium flavum]